MFRLFRKKRTDSRGKPRGSAPPLSGELKAERDREFVDRLQKGLDAQLRSAGPGKIEPRFKPSASSTSSPSPGASPSTANAERRRESEPSSQPPRQSPQSAGPRAPTPHPATPQAEVKAANGTAPAATPTAPVTTAAAPAPQADAQPIPSLPLVMRAAQFAADRHKAQRRKGAAREPYVNHVLEVAMLLAQASDGKDPDLVVAGLLHDLVEDQGVSADEVATKFGVGVAALVLEVTEDKSLPTAERRRLQIAHAAHKSPRARMLKIADVVSNLRALRQSPPADWPADRQQQYLQWAHDLVAGCRGINAHLDRAFDEVEAGFAEMTAADSAPCDTALGETIR